MKKIIFAALILWAGVIVMTLLVKGYQLPTNNRLTDDEIINSAIKRTLQQMLIEAPVIKVQEKNDYGMESYKSPSRVIPYKSVEHFLEENPECCNISGWHGSKVKKVNVNTTVFYLDDNNEVKQGDIEADYTIYFEN